MTTGRATHSNGTNGHNGKAHRAVPSFSIGQAVELASRFLSASATATSEANHDPMRLDLPPLVVTGRDAILGASTVRTMAALYLHGELEQAGVVRVAELLAAARDRIPFMSQSTARKLEVFAQVARDAYGARQRELFYARLFGTGGGATVEQGMAVNRDFERALAALAAALVRYAREQGYGASWTSLDAAIRQSANELLLNLAARQYGNTLVAARSLASQMQNALGILADNGVEAHFQTRGAWSTLRAILGSQTPDLGRLIARGQSGMRILTWLASTLEKINEPRPTTPLLAPGDPVLIAAAEWLQATGFATLPTMRGAI